MISDPLKFLLSSLFFTLFLSVTPSGLLAQELRMTPTSANDIWPKTIGSVNYNEYWNYQMYFDNGMSLYIIFSVSDFGRLKSAVSGIRVSMYGLDENTYHINREYPIEDLYLGKADFDFDINPRQDNIWFKGKLPESLEIYINTQKHGNRFKIHLNLTDIHPGYKPNNGEYLIDDHRVGMATHIPYARVTGTTGINDDVQEVSGVAYMDHAWQYQNSSKKLKNGYRFIKHVDSANWETIYFMEADVKQGKPFIGYRLSSKNGNVEMDEIDTVENSNPNDIEKATYTINFVGRDNVTLTAHKIQDRTSIFADLNWFTKSIMKTVLGGKIMDLHGTVTFTMAGNPPQNGYFNQFSLK